MGRAGRESIPEVTALLAATQTVISVSDLLSNSSTLHRPAALTPSLSLFSCV